jgi:IMP dehydrogenase
MSVEEQAEQVRKVKKFESGVVKDPITIQQNATIAELMELTSAHGISGVRRPGGYCHPQGPSL